MIPYGVVMAFTAALLARSVAASMSLGRVGHGLIGYGINMYGPECAFACRDSVTAPLNCTGDDMEDGGSSHHDMKKLKKRDETIFVKRMGDMGSDDGEQLPMGDGWMVMPGTPSCKAHSDFYLQTVAFCISQRCGHVPVDTLERFWRMDLLGHLDDQPVPQAPYTQARLAAEVAPRQELNNSLLLNYTGIVTEEIYLPVINALLNFGGVEVLHERFGLVIFLSGIVVPVVFSLLRFVPWPTSLTSKFNGYIIDPPAIGSRHATPVWWGLGIMPTRGQALFITYFWIINIVLSAVGLSAPSPDSWFATPRDRIFAFLGNRFGVLSFANIPLVMLYSGRNNILLWVTNWSHSTFLLVHRWVAFICMLQAVLHSLIYLAEYTMVEGREHATESKLPYWYWGIIGTLALVVMIPASVLPIRQRVYEVFLSSHIVLAILALIGCFLHIIYRFDRQWGYETWIYMAVGIWVFDRVVRVVRIARGGVRRAYVTAIDEDYFRIDIPGSDASGHVYLHFPTLSGWRIWESHPFSVVGVLARSSPGTLATSSEKMDEEGGSNTPGLDQCRISTNSGSGVSLPTSATPDLKDVGITMIARRMKGMTSLVAACVELSNGIPVFVEGSYGCRVSALNDEEVRPTIDFPNMVCIAGGVGITALVPVLQRHNNSTLPSLGTSKLYWGVRTLPLVHAVEDMIGVGADTRKNGDDSRWGRTEVVVTVGDRLNVRDVLEKELRGQTGGTSVVVCGPRSMADEARMVVAGLARNGSDGKSIVVRYIEESFAW